jgi:hypothetical protein
MSINYSSQRNSNNISIGLTAAGTTSASTQILGQNAFYAQLSTCTSGAHGIVLPEHPVMNVPYCIKNDGAWTALVFPHPSGTSSDVDGGASFCLANNGSEASFVAVQKSPLTANAVDLTWHSFNKSGKGILAIAGASAPTLTACTQYPIQVNLTSSAGAITLPDPTLCNGMRVKFIHTVDSAAVVTVVCTGGALINTNWLVTPGGAGNCVYTAATLRTTITWAAAGVVGDYQEYESNGVNWNGAGMSGAAAGYTNN